MLEEEGVVENASIAEIYYRIRASANAAAGGRVPIRAAHAAAT